MTLLLNSFYNLTIIKNGGSWTRDSFPIFFNSISKIDVSVKTGDIIVMNITLTPNFNDAIDILKSGILGIGLGSKEQKPQNTTKSLTALNIGLTTPKLAAPTVGGSGGLDKVIDGFAVVEIELLRPGEKIKDKDFKTFKYRGALTQPDVSIQGGDVSITMRGYGNAVFSQGPIAQFQFLGKTISDVVKACLEIIGYKSKTKEGQTTVDSKMSTYKIPDQAKTDTPYNIMKWALGLQKLSFLESLEDEKTIIIYDTDVSYFKEKDVCKYTFVQWRQVDPGNNVFPLISFNMDSARSLFLQGRAFGNYTLGMNEKTKLLVNNDNIKEKVKDDQYDDVKNQSKAMQIVDKNFKGWITATPTQESTEQVQTGLNEVVTGSSVYQKFTLETYGLPHILPLDKVNILIGDIAELSGMLIVNKVTHTLDSNGWVTSLETVKIGDIGQETPKELAYPMKKIENDSSGGGLLSKLASAL